MASKKKTVDDYEVGYQKPPKNTRFQKGISGNPRGCPKKAADFHSILIRESKSSMTINENGQRRRTSKHEVVIKQLIKLAMTGNIAAARTYFGLYIQALERVALVAHPQPNNSGKYDLSDEELMRIAAGGREKTEQEG
jgi:hypothetical protein